MKKISFNEEWTYFKDNNSENRVHISLPHDAMISENRSAVAKGGTNNGWFEGHHYTYEKEFFIPAEYEGEKIFFEFEGVFPEAEIIINEKSIATHDYGYTGFWIDVTQALWYGKKNSIKVLIDNTKQPNSRWYTGAGLYRPVWMYVLPQEHILPEGIKIKTLSHHPAKIRIEVLSNVSGNVQIEICKDSACIVTGEYHSGEMQNIELEIPDAILWSEDNPFLYECRVTFGEDSRRIPFGIRTVECDSINGLQINGVRTILHGACIHHDNGILGAIAHPYAEYRKIKILKENGYNAIRSAHNPCSKALLDACDRLGMYIVDEYADMWYTHKTCFDYADHVLSNWKRDLDDIVDKDYNHPSVIMYSLGNEVSETAQKRGIELCDEMTQYLHEKDNRPVTCGINLFFNFLSSMGLGVYSDKKAQDQAKKTTAKKGILDSMGSEFYNNLAGFFGAEFMKLGAKFPGSDMKTREAFSKLDVAGYNYGIKRYKRDLKKYPNRVILGSETFASDAYKFWKLAKANPALIGDFVWTGMDHLGEVGLGAWEYSDYAPDFSHGVGWITAGSGTIDLTGKPTAELAYTKVAFEMESIRMSVVPVNHTKDTHSPGAWRCTNAVESWSWAGCEGKEAIVEVYSRGASVGLFLNGKLMGNRRRGKDCKTVFHTHYEPGELLAISYDDSGKEIGRTALQTAADETVLNLKPEKEIISQEELCYLRLQYTDSNGCIKPLLRGDIRLKISGGELLGFGNGCPYNERGYTSDISDTYFGEALAIIRPNGNDNIRVHAESKYGNATLEIRCKKECET